MSDPRKRYPVYEGLFAYFPDALKEVSHVSEASRKQHNLPELGWDRSKSPGDTDSAGRHLIDRAAGEVFDDDGLRHLAKAAWRVLAALQKELEADKPMVSAISAKEFLQNMRDNKPITAAKIPAETKQKDIY